MGFSRGSGRAVFRPARNEPAAASLAGLRRMMRHRALVGAAARRFSDGFFRPFFPQSAYRRKKAHTPAEEHAKAPPSFFRLSAPPALLPSAFLKRKGKKGSPLP